MITTLFVESDELRYAAGMPGLVAERRLAFISGICAVIPWHSLDDAFPPDGGGRLLFDVQYGDQQELASAIWGMKAFL
ncbi:hypothetical protein OHD26_10770 [Escherichia coli]|nr:hypothetical protein [Escherichia coli]